MNVATGLTKGLDGGPAHFSTYRGMVRRGAMLLIKQAANDNKQGTFGSFDKDGYTRATLGQGDITIEQNPAELAKAHRDAATPQTFETHHNIKPTFFYYSNIDTKALIDAIPDSPISWAKSVGTTIAETLGFGSFRETEEEKSKRLEKERIKKAVEEFERNHAQAQKLADIEAAEKESAKILMDHAKDYDSAQDTPEDEKIKQSLAEYLAENPWLIDRFLHLSEGTWVTNKAANYLAGKISAVSKSIKRAAAQCGKEVADFIKDECPTCVKVLSRTADTASELADHTFPVVAYQIARMEFAKEVNDFSSVVGNYIDHKTTPEQRESVSLITDILSIFVPLGLVGYAKFAAKLDKVGDIIDDATGTPFVFKKYWEKHIEFKGNKVYQRDDLIDPKRIHPKEGMPNLDVMRLGKAPVGPDGKSINLHHTIQTPNGPIAEVTETFHKQYTKIIHINPKTTQSGIDRRQFDKWREQYWKERAKDFEGK